MIDPTYSVLSGDHRFRAIKDRRPAHDASVLLREWDRAGYRIMSLDLARQVGAAVVVIRDGADEPDLADELPAVAR